MVVEIKTDVDKKLLILKMKKSSILAKSIGNFLFIIKTKSSPSTSVFIFSTICEIFNTKLNVFWTGICRNWTKLFAYTYILTYRSRHSILQIETCHRPLFKWQRQSANSVRAKERDDKWFFLSLSTRTELATVLARDSLTRNSLSLSSELTGFRLACLLYL